MSYPNLISWYLAQTKYIKICPHPQNYRIVGEHLIYHICLSIFCADPVFSLTIGRIYDMLAIITYTYHMMSWHASPPIIKFWLKEMFWNIITYSTLDAAICRSLQSYTVINTQKTSNKLRKQKFSSIVIMQTSGMSQHLRCRVLCC